MAINHQPAIHQLVICANVFIRKGDKYLVLKRSPLKRFAPSYFHPVGGKVDLGEAPLDAAKREALEETGVTVKNLSLRAVILEIDPVKSLPGNWLIFYFIGDYESGTVGSTEEGELIWLTEAEFKTLKLFPSVKATVDKMFDTTHGPVMARFEFLSDTEINPSTAQITATV